VRPHAHGPRSESEPPRTQRASVGGILGTLWVLLSGGGEESGWTGFFVCNVIRYKFSRAQTPVATRPWQRFVTYYVTNRLGCWVERGGSVRWVLISLGPIPRSLLRLGCGRARRGRSGVGDPGYRVACFNAADLAPRIFTVVASRSPGLRWRGRARSRVGELQTGPRKMGVRKMKTASNVSSVDLSAPHFLTISVWRENLTCSQPVWDVRRGGVSGKRKPGLATLATPRRFAGSFAQRGGREEREGRAAKTERGEPRRRGGTGER
jgi:hypothetical protein